MGRNSSTVTNIIVIKATISVSNFVTRLEILEQGGGGQDDCIDTSRQMVPILSQSENMKGKN